MTRYPILVCAALVCFGSLAACTVAAPEATMPSANNAQTDALLTVAELVKIPTNWAGKMVKVSGYFQGWQGKCTGRPPVSRSDWMMQSDAACLYVSGRLPPELSSIPPARGVGKPIVVVGKVFVDQSGFAYIQSTRVSLR